jgi:hypothetical protein
LADFINAVFPILVYVVIYVPVVALIAAVAFLGIGIYQKVKSIPCKNSFTLAVLVFFIPNILWLLLFVLIGFIGFGPGLGDLA